MGWFSRCALLCVLALPASLQAAPQYILRDLSLNKPLVLDEDAAYQLVNVTVTGVSDCAALTLAGRIRSVTIERSTFGRVWAGPEDKAAGLECAGALVGALSAVDSTFFDAEHYLASLKEGSFQRVTFQRCRFATSEGFLKELYSRCPWRSSPPVTEFHNIERLELLDNEFTNTTVLIHPSVKQVILRGQMPGLRILNRESTRFFQLQPGQLADSIAPPPRGPAPAIESVASVQG